MRQQKETRSQAGAAGPFLKVRALRAGADSPADGCGILPGLAKEILAKQRWMLSLFVLLLLVSTSCQSHGRPRFEIYFPGSLHTGPITGRMFVFITKDGSKEPRLQAGSYHQRTPFFGTDVTDLQPGESAVIDGSTLGYPIKSLGDIPAGNYYVQALLNVYTQFHRADGHTIWAHMDHWEGQQFNISPGNLYSDVERIHLDPNGYTVSLKLSRVIPPIRIVPDTRWVKRIKIQSALLTKFWGHPMYLGAVVILPKGYDSHPHVYYPVDYEQDHFSLDAPYDFRTVPPRQRLAELPSDLPQLSDTQQVKRILSFEREQGYRFFQAWNSVHFPRMLMVTFLHPTPYYDDSYAVNSSNDGPYGDAIMTELIPYIESHFRIIRKPYARLLSGGSTGGWESLALQAYHPGFFGGAWIYYPDPVDFRQWQLTNIYEDQNAFSPSGFAWIMPERPWERSVDGQVWLTQREESQLEEVLGSHGRSGQQVDAWQAVYGPVGKDGYPEAIWSKASGQINHQVADYMRSHGYDLRYYLQTHWSKIGAQLRGKLHIYCGDMDNYYLNNAVYLLESFLKSTRNPYYGESFEFGGPMKGHGIRPTSTASMVRAMATYIAKRAPRDADLAAWHY